MNWLLIVAFVASMFAGGAGAAHASQDALPGDALYGVKNAVQNVQLSLSDDEGDVDLLLGFMGEHIEEMKALTEMGHFQWIETALDEYNGELEQLNQTRIRINYDDAGTEDSLNTRIQTQIASQLEELVQLQTRLQDQQQIQDKLQQTIRAAENGAGFGPGVGGPNEEPGSPNGAGPGEPQGDGQKNESPGSGSQDEGQGTGSQNEDPGNNGNGAGNTAQGAGQGVGNGDSGPQLGETCEPSFEGQIVEGLNEDGTGNGVFWTCVDGFWNLYQGQGEPGNGNGQGHGEGGKP